MAETNKYIIGVYDDETVLLKAIGQIRESGTKIKEVFSPYPVHGLDEALGYKRSRLPIAAFLFGATGTSLALLMQIWMMAVDWPMIIGGKNFASVTFVPITFELTVLLSAFGMVGTFFVVSNLKPWGKSVSPDLRSTDDKHIMMVPARNAISPSEINELLTDTGASEVYDKEVIENE